MKRLMQLWCLVGIVALIMLIFSKPVYRLWVGDEIKVQVSISIVMAGYVLLNAWNAIFSHFLNGVGKIKLQLYSAAFAALANIPLGIFLGKHLGIYGVVLATTILASVSSIWSPLQYYKLINNKAKGIWNK